MSEAQERVPRRRARGQSPEKLLQGVSDFCRTLERERSERAAMFRAGEACQSRFAQSWQEVVGMGKKVQQEKRVLNRRPASIAQWLGDLRDCLETPMDPETRQKLASLVPVLEEHLRFVLDDQDRCARWDQSMRKLFDSMKPYILDGQESQNPEPAQGDLPSALRLTPEQRRVLYGELHSARPTWKARVFHAVATTGACTTGTLWRQADRVRTGEAVKELADAGLLEWIDPGPGLRPRAKLFRLTASGREVASRWLRQEPARCLWERLLSRHNGNAAHALLVLEVAGLCNKFPDVQLVELEPGGFAGYEPDLAIVGFYGGSERTIYVEVESDREKRERHFFGKLDHNLQANGGEFVCFAFERPSDWQKAIEPCVRRWLREAGRPFVSALVISLCRKGTGEGSGRATLAKWAWRQTVERPA